MSGIQDTHNAKNTYIRTINDHNVFSKIHIIIHTKNDLVRNSDYCS